MAAGGSGDLQVEIHGLDVYDPTTGAVRSDSTDDIACWFIDTAYEDQQFFVRHAYFLGANDPYDKLKRALRADIDEAAWASLHSTVSRPFSRQTTKGRTVDRPVVRTFLPSVHQVNVGSRISLIRLPYGSYPRSAGPTSRQNGAWIPTSDHCVDGWQETPSVRRARRSSLYEMPCTSGSTLSETNDRRRRW